MSKSRSMKPAVKAATSVLALSVMMGAGVLPAVADTHTVSRGDTLSGIAAKHGVSLDSLFKANSMGMGSIIYPGQKITYGTTSTPAPAPVQQAGGSVHTVVPGDTLGGIAKRYGVSLDSVFKANGMGMSTVIHPGQKIKLSGTGTPAPAPVQQAAPAPAPVQQAGGSAHTVAPGDTLGGIAKRYGVSLESVFKANGMGMSTVIHPGQKIKLSGTAITPAPVQTPAPTPVQTKPATPAGAYTVVSGDTMGAIASRHGVSLSSLLQANGLQSNSVIYVGQRIALPSGNSTPTPAPAPAPVQQAPVATSGAALQQLVRTTALNMGVDPVLAQAIAFQESGFRQGVVSYAGAVGTMQVMPNSGIWASELVGRTLDLNKTEDNVTAGVAIIAALVRSSDSLEDAIASYYQGQYSVQTIGYYDDTKDYVASVKTHMGRFS